MARTYEDLPGVEWVEGDADFVRRADPATFDPPGRRG
jgi:hypothetical protein